MSKQIIYHGRHPTHQIAFCTDEALKCIKFIGIEEK